uniref:F-box domain-containing protein n=1 Tax=Oryza punctata TaxID=4537 RepID=A0A0E0M0T7_ORYPU
MIGLQVHESPIKKKLERDQTIMVERDWSSLPFDVLTVILERLRWSSHPSFALSCRHWHSAVPPFYPAWITPLLLNTARVGVTNLRYYSPYYHKNFEVGSDGGGHMLGAARGAKICCGSGRHLALGMSSAALDVDLLTGVVHKVPHVYKTMFDFIIYGDDACKMFGIDAVVPLKVAYVNQDDDGDWEDWTLTEFDINGPRLIPSPVTNPVIHRGLIYLLGEQGRLAVYDPCKHEKGFEILDKPMNFGFECYDSYDIYMFESDKNKLMVILIGQRGAPVHVVTLNENTMEWDKVDSLQGRALFTGTQASMMKKAELEWMQNRVFLPIFYKWLETVHVDLVSCDDELAFIPKSFSNTDYSTANEDGENCVDMWSYKLGQQEAAREFWGAEKMDYSIWIDLN